MPNDLPNDRKTRFRVPKGAWIGALIALWVLVHLCISGVRSFWMDEITRFAQMNLGFVAALKDLFKEPSPFAPGEIILGHLSKSLFGMFTSPELNQRIPSVIWGALTLWLSFKFTEEPSRNKRPPYFLPILVAFSVALTGFSTQARPYSALYFSGALSFHLIWRSKHPLSRAEQAVTWFTIFLTHLYGICFVALACFFRKDWRKFLAATAWVAVILLVYTRFHGGAISRWDSRIFPGAVDTFKQVMGTLGNPHKASYLLIPLFLLGFQRIARSRPILALQTAALLLATVAGPLFATYAGNYFFAPRQAIAGAFPFLAVSAVGLNWIVEEGSRFSKIAAMGVALGIAALASLLPWTLSIVLQRPPYADQPIHRYKQIADRILDSLNTKPRNIMVVDPGGTTQWYLELKIGKPGPTSVITRGDLRVLKRCWEPNRPLCLYFIDEIETRFADPSLLELKPEFSNLVNTANPPFDLLVYSYFDFHIPTTVPMVRTW